MHILCVDQFSNLGGGQQCFLDLAPAFRQRGWGLRAVLPGEGQFSDKLRALGCPVRTFVGRTLSNKHKPIWEIAPYCLNLRRAYDALLREVRYIRPDLIYVNSPRLLPAAAWVASRNDIPLLFHAHNRLLQGPAVSLVGRVLAQSHATVLSCCSFAASPLKRHLRSDTVRVVYNGTRDLATGDRVRSAGIRNIGLIGRIAPEKGQLEFVRAVRLLVACGANQNFLLVGAPSSRELSYYRAALSESRGLPISFEGWNDSVADVLANLDLVVVPSRYYDAAPRVILEAFSARVPVVAFASGGIPELITDNCTGFLASPQRPSALAERLLDVTRMPAAEVQSVAAEARRTWERQFRVERYREEVCEAVLDCARVARSHAA